MHLNTGKTMYGPMRMDKCVLNLVTLFDLLKNKLAGVIAKNNVDEFDGHEIATDIATVFFTCMAQMQHICLKLFSLP